MAKSRAIKPEAKMFLRQARGAMRSGEKSEAIRLARRAAVLEPNWEVPWLIMAAKVNAEMGLSYVAKALELNPESKPA